jgi:hypothetical protein
MGAISARSITSAPPTLLSLSVSQRLFVSPQTGCPNMNQCDTLDPALPWTAAKNSGKGATLSALGFLHLTRPKSINFKLG